MKKILLLAGVISLLTTTGCLSSREEWRGHANNARYVEDMAGPPAIEVHARVGEARPPETTVR